MFAGKSFFNLEFNNKINFLSSIFSPPLKVKFMPDEHPPPQQPPPPYYPQQPVQPQQPIQPQQPATGGAAPPKGGSSFVQDTSLWNHKI